MANCNTLFQEYNTIIRLPDNKRQELIIVRDNLRTRLRDGYLIVSHGFKHQHQLISQTQGSFIMDTIITPIRRDYDLDDGIYFIGRLSKNQRPKPSEFHDWVKQALDRGFDDIEKIIDKDTCIRVIYKDGFHVDLPIYYADNIDSPDLAHKIKGWTLSNPIEFIAWFEDKIQSGFLRSFIYETKMFAEYEKWSSDIRKNDHQLRRIVRYLKSWGDLRREEMPCGIVLTILAANNYSPHERDDISLKETLINIRQSLQQKFECLRPTTPAGEDLLETYKNKDAFLNYLNTFIVNANKALEEQNHKKACEHWQKSLGDRFPCYLAKDEKISNYATIGLGAAAAGSRPYGH